MKWHIGDKNGTIIGGVPGVRGSNATLLYYPDGITLDQWKNLDVADRFNNRIKLFCNGSIVQALPWQVLVLSRIEVPKKWGYLERCFIRERRKRTYISNTHIQAMFLIRTDISELSIVLALKNSFFKIKLFLYISEPRNVCCIEWCNN